MQQNAKMCCGVCLSLGYYSIRVWRHGGVMVRMLDSQLRGPDSNPGSILGQDTYFTQT